MLVVRGSLEAVLYDLGSIGRDLAALCDLVLRFGGGGVHLSFSWPSVSHMGSFMGSLVGLGLQKALTDPLSVLILLKI